MNSDNYTKLEREPNTILIMDTTLRDGEQNSLCTMYQDEKVEIAKKLEEMNVDIIEAGFAISPGHLETMKQIAGIVKTPYLCGLARAMKKDIDATLRAYENYDKRMIHIFVPTSQEHVDAKLKKSEQELIEMAAECVRYAAKYFPVVEFTPEDSVRSNNGRLKKIIEEVLKRGALVINVADTVGAGYPDEFGSLIHQVRTWVKKENPTARVSVHCHNDLGLCTANTYFAIKNGAEQVECTLYGIGERAGNCPLEQIVAIGMKKPEVFTTNIKSEKLYEAVKMVEEATGIRNDFAPIVGKSAFAHKAGIHQQGMINSRVSYEFLNPKDFGRESEIIVGASSGYHGVMFKAEELGYLISKEQAIEIINMIAAMVKNKIKKRFSDLDIKEMLESMG